MPQCVYTYILADRPRGSLTTGVTRDLVFRTYQQLHAAGPATGAKRLVWFEEHSDMRQALQRQKQLKTTPRPRKIDLIEQSNPLWRDLYPEISKKQGLALVSM
jgi:putative endonuclease